ncbi:MAG: FAD-dependent oxidoreductase [Acidimicrobiales bacterium]
MTVDVTVIGSGVAGLTAAVAAATVGATVRVLESESTIGGTTALSGGQGWFPANRWIVAEGDEADPPEAARRYLDALGLGDTEPELLDVFVADADRCAAFVADATPVGWHTMPYPDYHSERPGGRAGGRTLEPDPLLVAGEIAARVRPAPNVSAPITYRELVTGTIDREAVAERLRTGTLTMGRALVAGLLAAAVDHGVEVLTGRRVTDRPEGRVILATGGFGRDPKLVASFLGGPMLAPTGAPGARGDGLRMALAAGAALGNMSQAWWCPALRIPGETIDGEPLYRLVLTERARPGCLIVDGDGRRFANEAQNYNDFGRALHAFSPERFGYPRIPSWLVFDHGYRSRYGFGPRRPSDDDPSWFHRADTVEELGKAIDVDPVRLAATVDEFNDFAAAGHDADFGRGSYAYDRFVGDPKAPHPTLGAVGEPPFYAVEILPGCLGTKGGPRTDADGRVLRADGNGVVPDLYAAGNAAASPFGLAYPGPGGTIGPAVVFGVRSGEAAATD